LSPSRRVQHLCLWHLQTTGRAKSVTPLVGSCQCKSEPNPDGSMSCLRSGLGAGNNQRVRPLNYSLFMVSFKHQSMYTYLQLQNTRDIPPCCLGSKMVRDKLFSFPLARTGRLMRPPPHIRCHTTPSRRPLMAVAKAEGSVDLFEWELEQVSYGFDSSNEFRLSFLILPTTPTVETTSSR
jgi:hypothetical protein